MHWGSYYDSVLAIEMENKIPSLSSTVMLIFFFFSMLVSLYGVINVKKFREILKFFFEILVTPQALLSSAAFCLQNRVSYFF